MARGADVKVPTLELGGLFKNYDLHKVESLAGCAFSWDRRFKPKLLDDKICSRSGKAVQGEISSKDAVSDCVLFF